MADGVGGVLGSARALQSAVDEQLKEIESERPNQQDGHESVGGVAKYVREVPVLDPLVKGCVLDMPPSSDSLEGCADGQLTCPLSNDGGAPGAFAQTRFGLGHLSPYHADLAFVGIKRLKFVDVPEFYVLSGLRIVDDSQVGTDRFAAFGN